MRPESYPYLLYCNACLSGATWLYRGLFATSKPPPVTQPEGAPQRSRARLRPSSLARTPAPCWRPCSQAGSGRNQPAHLRHDTVADSSRVRSSPHPAPLATARAKNVPGDRGEAGSRVLPVPPPAPVQQGMINSTARLFGLPEPRGGYSFVHSPVLVRAAPCKELPFGPAGS